MNNKFKLMALLLCFAATAMMVSCTPEKEEETNPLVGTKWACKYSNSNMVIEFVSAKEVQAYFANSALAYERGLTSGSYTVSGSNVTFNNLDLVWEVLSSRSHYKPQKGTFSGSIMQTQGQQSIYSDNDWMTWNETWNKQ